MRRLAVAAVLTLATLAPASADARPTFSPDIERRIGAGHCANDVKVYAKRSGRLTGMFKAWKCRDTNGRHFLIVRRELVTYDCKDGADLVQLWSVYRSSGVPVNSVGWGGPCPDSGYVVTETNFRDFIIGRPGFARYRARSSQYVPWKRVTVRPPWIRL